jgi:D-alanyl-D-alanine carboxypeptidase
MITKSSLPARVYLALLFLSLALQLHAQFSAETQAAVDKAVENQMKQTGLVSTSIAVVQDGKLAYAHAYGLARIEGRVLATPGMRYKIGSNSKQITAAAMLLLTGQGKVSLDDPVSRFFRI